MHDIDRENKVKKVKRARSGTRSIAPQVFNGDESCKALKSDQVEKRERVRAASGRQHDCSWRVKPPIVFDQLVGGEAMVSGRYGDDAGVMPGLMHNEGKTRLIPIR